MATKPRLLADLFAGCGGLSLGLEQAGFTSAYVNELNNDALGSYLTNRLDRDVHLTEHAAKSNDIKQFVLSKKVKSETIRYLREFHCVDIRNGELDLVAGGPPCQGYSGIGHRRSYGVDKEQLPSNHLYQDMAYFVACLMPKIFLFENVKGLLSAKWTANGKKGEIWNDVKRTFENIGEYEINYALVTAKDYGVPQNRPRVLLVGIRKDVYRRVEHYIPQLSSTAGGFLPDPNRQPMNLIDVLGDLVDPEFKNGGKTEAYPNPSANAIQDYYRTDKAGVIAPAGAPLTEQEYSKHSAHVIEKFEYMISNEGRIPPHLQTKKFAQRLLLPEWGQNGPNITATSLADDYVHFAQPRIPTVREWARLQGFPDWYEFRGSRTTGGIRRAGNPKANIYDRELPKYTQIGNAVPVFLAQAVGHHFDQILSFNEEN